MHLICHENEKYEAGSSLKAVKFWMFKFLVVPEIAISYRYLSAYGQNAQFAHAHKEPDDENQTMHIGIWISVQAET